jgi:reversibly glycosylated polypeptide/UDP-arabinopyranose mutase
MRILVVPSCRKESWQEFLSAWEGAGGWDRLILVEDGPQRSFPTPPNALHYSWEEIDRALGADSWIISRQDSAIRCFGFLAAWWAGARYVLTLDDDCYPHPPHQALFAAHIERLHGQRAWVESVPGMRTRGLPYGEIGCLTTVKANVGLWTGMPDLGAPEALLRPSGNARPFKPPPGSRLIPHRQYVPVCGMNLCLAREAVPCFYFPPQGRGWPYRRMDDIWAGILAKKMFDSLGWHLAVGEPFVEHRKASCPFANLIKEAPGIAANEQFWRMVDRQELDAGLKDPCLAASALGGQLQRHTGCDLGDYIGHVGRALEVWAGLFRQRPANLEV